jgi:hypothetical protein
MENVGLPGDGLQGLVRRLLAGAKCREEEALGADSGLCSVLLWNSCARSGKDSSGSLESIQGKEFINQLHDCQLLKDVSPWRWSN